MHKNSLLFHGTALPDLLVFLEGHFRLYQGLTDPLLQDCLIGVVLG